MNHKRSGPPRKEEKKKKKKIKKEVRETEGARDPFYVNYYRYHWFICIFNMHRLTCTRNSRVCKSKVVIRQASSRTVHRTSCIMYHVHPVFTWLVWLDLDLDKRKILLRIINKSNEMHATCNVLINNFNGST